MQQMDHILNIYIYNIPTSSQRFGRLGTGNKIQEEAVVNSGWMPFIEPSLASWWELNRINLCSLVLYFSSVDISQINIMLPVQYTFLFLAWLISSRFLDELCNSAGSMQVPGSCALETPFCRWTRHKARGPVRVISDGQKTGLKMGCFMGKPPLKWPIDKSSKRRNMNSLK